LHKIFVEAVKAQIKCPCCGGSFTDKHFERGIGCRPCGIFMSLGHAYIFGNTCPTNDDYLKLVRKAKDNHESKSDKGL
jgi:hypothetical protein